MKTLLYKKIDAFTDGVSSGNPAGVVYIPAGESLSAAQMQAVAKRFTKKGVKDRVNEVAFCTPSGKNSFSLRYFSFNCEVELCGHATIALMYDIIKNDPYLLRRKSAAIKTVKGELSIANDIPSSGYVFITAQAPEHLPCNISANKIAGLLKTGDINPKPELAIINGGLRTLIVPINSLNSVVSMLPDENSLKEFSLANDFDVCIVFTSEVSLRSSRFRTRVFCPKYGYLEDPATGSANIALGYYLLEKNMWDGGLLSIEQGTSLDHPSIIKLKTAKSGKERRVMAGGNGVVRFERKIFL